MGYEAFALTLFSYSRKKALSHTIFIIIEFSEIILYTGINNQERTIFMSMKELITPRTLITSLINICLVITKYVPDYYTNTDMTIPEIIEYDVSLFIFWLCTIDGNVTKKEIEFIKECYPNMKEPLTEQECFEIMKEHSCLGNDFLTAQPAILRALVEADNLIYKENPNGNNNLCDIFYQILRAIGESIVNTDGFSPIKQNALGTFLYMIASYMNRHSIRP